MLSITLFSRRVRCTCCEISKTTHAPVKPTLSSSLKPVVQLFLNRPKPIAERIYKMLSMSNKLSLCATNQAKRKAINHHPPNCCKPHDSKKTRENN